ncbi:MAG: flippase-like domain-containing protein [Sulfuriferula multivorans]|uniref:Flippase-like domain-containing protein n=1 Tax=Sulfuriferula multivorans TaxID=1559896 RepID=A0A7C9TBE1_9PROT|nr:flippase-like domain-containing protein [Sulfuriferula multivorans]
MPASHRRQALRSKLFLGLANVVLLYMLYRWVANNIDLDRLQQSLWRIPASALLLSVAVNLSALGLYGLRMQMLLRRGFIESFAVINIGYVLNTLIPLRLGEIMKIWLSHRLFRLPVTEVVAASVAEKLFDLFKLLLLGGILVALAAGRFVPGGLLPSLVLFLSVAAAGIFLLRYKVVAIIRLIPKKSRLRRIAISLHRHADEYPLVRVFVISLAIWTMNVLLMYVTFNSFILGIRVELTDAIALLLIISLAIAVPSAPASIGLFEAGLVAYLTQVLHADTEAALAAAVMLHLVITIPQMFLTGLLLLVSRRSHV